MLNGYNSSENVVRAAREAACGMSDMRIMRAERGAFGWRLKYVAIDDDYPIAALENKITRIVGEKVSMVGLHYDADTTARLIYSC